MTFLFSHLFLARRFKLKADAKGHGIFLTIRWQYQAIERVNLNFDPVGLQIDKGIWIFSFFWFLCLQKKRPNWPKFFLFFERKWELDELLYSTSNVKRITNIFTLVINLLHYHYCYEYIIATLFEIWSQRFFLFYFILNCPYSTISA